MRRPTTLLAGDAARFIDPRCYAARGRWSSVCERMSLVSALTAILALTIEEICALPLSTKKIVSGTVLKVPGFRARDMPLTPELEIAIRRWLAVRPKTNSKLLLVTPSGGRLSPPLIRQTYMRAGERAGFQGGDIHKRLRRFCVRELERAKTTDFGVLARFRGFHKDAATYNPLPAATPVQMRKMLVEGHPLRGTGATLFESEVAFPDPEDAKHNLPPIPAADRAARPPAVRATAVRDRSRRETVDAALRELRVRERAIAAGCLRLDEGKPEDRDAGREKKPVTARHHAPLELLDGDAARMMHPYGYNVGGRPWSPAYERTALASALGAIYGLTSTEIRSLPLPQEVDGRPILKVQGPRARDLPVVPSIAAAIARWLLLRPRVDSPLLLVTRDGGKLTHADIWRYRVRSGRRSGFRGEDIQTALRLYCVTALMRAEADRSSLARLLGLGSAGGVTASVADVAEMLGRCHPLYAFGAAGSEEAPFDELDALPRDLAPIPASDRIRSVPPVRGRAKRPRKRCPEPVPAVRAPIVVPLDEGQSSDPEIASILATPLPIDRAARKRTRRNLTRRHRRSIVRRIAAGELTDGQAALLLSARVSTMRRWIDTATEPPPARPRPDGIAAGAWRVEIDALFARMPHASVEAAMLHLAASRLARSEPTLRKYLRSRRLGPYAPEAKRAAVLRGWSEPVHGPLPLDDETIRSLAERTWADEKRGRSAERRRLRKAHLPHVHASIACGALWPEGGARLFRIEPDTMRSWIERREIALARPGAEPAPGSRRRGLALPADVRFDDVLLDEPTVALLFRTPVPVDPDARERSVRNLVRGHRLRIVRMVGAGELTPEQAAVLLSVEVATVRRWMEAERTPHPAAIVLSEAWCREIEDLFARAPRTSVARARDLLKARQVDVSDHVLRQHLKRRRLGPYSDDAERMRRSGRRFPPPAPVEEDWESLPLGDETVRLLAETAWRIDRYARRSQRVRLREKHLPRIRVLIGEGRLSEAWGATLFGIMPDTMTAWIAKRDAFLAAGGVDEGARRPAKLAPPPEWTAAIEQVFSANPGISGLEAHRRLWDRGYRQSYFVMWRYADENGLTGTAAPEPEWCRLLEAVLKAEGEIDLRAAHRRLEGIEGLPSYYTIRRYAKRLGLAKPRPIGPKSRKKRAEIGA